MYRPGRRAFVIAVVVLIAALHNGSVPPMIAAEATWRVVETPRVTVVSQLPDKAAQAWAEELTFYVGELCSMIRVNEELLPPLTAVLFAGDKDYDLYHPPKPGDKAPKSFGYFGNRDTWSVAVARPGPTDDVSRHTIYHEGVHWFLSADVRAHPAWLGEGLAEVFSTFRLEGDRLRWGDAIEMHVRKLQSPPVPSLASVLAAKRTDPLFRDAAQTNRFYAKSWLLVHYLLFGKQGGEPGALLGYIDALRSAPDADAAFEQSFGRSVKKMEIELGDYLRGGKYLVATRQVAPDERPKLAIRPPAPHEVDVALGRVAICNGLRDLAKQHVARAVQLAPDRPEGFDLQALLADQDKDNATAVAAGERALALGSKDAWTLLCLGAARHRRDLDGDGRGPTREVIDLYERAVNLRPDIQRAYGRIARLLPAVDAVTPDDAKFLLLGRRLFPDDVLIVLGLAVHADRSGDRAAAEKLFAQIPADKLTGDARKLADQFLARWGRTAGGAGAAKAP
jgi:hypothetical protein